MQGLIDNQQVSKHNLKSKFSIFQDDFLDFETPLKYQVKIKAFKRQVEEAEEIAALNLAKFRQVTFCEEAQVYDLLWGTSSVRFGCNADLVSFYCLLDTNFFLGHCLGQICSIVVIEEMRTPTKLMLKID